MNRKPIIAVVLFAALGGAATVLPFPWSLGDGRNAGHLLGYAEGEAVLVGAKAAGRLVSLAVRQGDTVRAGDLLFVLDANTQEAAVAEAAARLEKARAVLEDLRLAQQRPEQIDVLQASRRQAEAVLALSTADLQRQQTLFDQGIIAQARLDQARTAFERDRAALAEIDQQIRSARMAARESRIAAADADVAASEAARQRAEAALDDRTVTAPRAGRVTELFYRQGEIVGAGQPVLEILPPESVHVRFYVPQARLAAISVGDRVGVVCDGCPPELAARVTYIAPEAEFTPPVIFSREQRAKLVFLAKARPETAGLKPGLPVEVVLPQELPAQ